MARTRTVSKETARVATRGGGGGGGGGGGMERVRVEGESGSLSRFVCTKARPLPPSREQKKRWECDSAGSNFWRDLNRRGRKTPLLSLVSVSVG